MNQIVIDAPTLLESARLVLRMPVPADALHIFEAYAQDAEVARYMTWPPHTNVETTMRFVAFCLDNWESQAAFPWVIVARDSGALIGMVEARIRVPAIDLGYVLARPYWGKGLMSEAVQSVVDWALAQPGVYRVWATCDVENERSARVLERVGMQREGILRQWIMHPNISDDARDCYCYARVCEMLAFPSSRSSESVGDARVARFAPLPPVPSSPQRPPDPRQSKTPHVLGGISDAVAEQAHLAGPNLTCGFYAAAVDIGRLQDELHRGIQRFDCIQLEERWGEVFTWIRQLLGRWVQCCKRMDIERLEAGIRIGLQTQDDHGYYEYQFDVFCKAS